MSINLTVVLISQSIHTSNHHTVHFRYLTMLFVSYSSVKLEGEKKIIMTTTKEIQIMYGIWPGNKPF